MKKIKLMGKHEKKMEENLHDLKVKGEIYFGIDNYVGISLHKIFKDFDAGQSGTLLKGLEIIDEDVFEKFSHLWSLLTKVHMFISKETTDEEEKQVAATAAEKFTRLFPVYFPEQNITRKIHTLGFTVPDIIRSDKTENICYK